MSSERLSDRTWKVQTLGCCGWFDPWEVWDHPPVSSLGAFPKFHFEAVLEHIDFSVSSPPTVFLVSPMEHILSPHHSQETFRTCTTAQNWRQGSSQSQHASGKQDRGAVQKVVKRTQDKDILFLK